MVLSPDPVPHAFSRTDVLGQALSLCPPPPVRTGLWAPRCFKWVGVPMPRVRPRRGKGRPAGRRSCAASSVGRPPAPPRGLPAGNGARATQPIALPSDGSRRTISAPLAPRAGSRGERSSPEMGVFVPERDERASARTFIVVLEDERSAGRRTPSPGGAFVDVPRRRRASPLNPMPRQGARLWLA
jgi:hypothetical protein